ncbi:MAG: FixH family protein [Rhizobiales bacterium]|nr:FixH family protein [Hyphomicrobiales bacterium]
MKSNYLCAAIVAVAMGLSNAAAFAGAADYTFESVAPEWKKGDDVVVAVRLTHKPSGKPVADAVIVRTRVDMGPDNMADMVSPVAAVPSKEPGVYAFKTDLPMAGRYMFSIAAKVQGEPETVVGKVILKAVK